MTCQTTVRPGGARRALSLVLIVMLGAGAFAGCGKKGPPLAPLVRLPARPEAVVARRHGSLVYVQFQIPTANTDRTTPADLSRVEVYGFTGQPLDNADLLQRGTRVASVPVRKPLDEDEAEPARPARSRQEPSRAPAAGEAAKPAPAKPARPPASLEHGFDQGNVVLVTEALGPQQMKELPPRQPKVKAPPPRVNTSPVPDIVLRPAPGPARIYVVVGVSRHGKKGPLSGRVSVPLLPAGGAPSAPTPTYDDQALTVAFVPPAGARRAIMEPPAEGELESTDRVVSLPSLYNVYEVPPPDSGGKPPAPPAKIASLPGPAIPTPLNEKPLAAPPFKDPRLEFGRTRCYVVRSALVFAPTMTVESEASPPGCVTPRDTFGPVAPTGLSAVASEGAISLIWNANTESDLAGYWVLRAPASGGDLTPLTPAPVKETTFKDDTVTRGVRYTYVVVAVDSAGNRSHPSNQAQETAR